MYGGLVIVSLRQHRLQLRARLALQAQQRLQAFLCQREAIASLVAQSLSNGRHCG